MSLNDALTIVEIFGIFGVIYGIWTGLKHFKLDSKQRRDLAVMECSRPFEDREFTEAYRLLTNLEPNLSREQFLALGKEYENAALRVCMKFETVGLLVFKGVVPFDAMEDLVGGAAVTLWEVLKKWVQESRSELNHPTFLEWYQWLIDRLKESGTPDRQPAFLIHNNWKSDF